MSKKLFASLLLISGIVFCKLILLLHNPSTGLEQQMRRQFLLSNSPQIDLLPLLFLCPMVMDSAYAQDTLNRTAKIQVPPPAESENMALIGSTASVVLDPSLEVWVKAKTRKLPSSQYKGVVHQPNGRWGAQIYERHRRIWLGTFAGEAEAAHAYDVAAQRFRGHDSVTNFKPLSESGVDEGASQTLAFLAAHSKMEIVDMLRKHTYHDEFEQSKLRGGDIGGGRGGKPSYCDQSAREFLFEKAVTPSDVGKLNRLVIPKQQAEKNFALKSGTEAACKGVLLNFKDAAEKVWRFRYSYWNSSQSYVLTKGWIRFVKEKSLKAGDVVSFWRSTGLEKQLYIVDRKRGGAAAEINGDSAKAATPAPYVRLFGVNISDGSSAATVRIGRREMDAS